MGHERTLPLDLLVEAAEPVAVAVDREVGDHPHDQSEVVDERADVEELGAQRGRPEVDDVEPGIGRGLPRPLGVARRGRLERAAERLADRVHRRRPDLLGEVGAARRQEAGDLGPVGHGRMPAAHEVERPAPQGHGRLVAGGGDDPHAERTQPPDGDVDVREPALGGDQQRREVDQLAQQLAAAGLEVHHPRRPRRPPSQQAGVAPRRPLLGRPAVEPREVPAVDRRGVGLVDQVVEGAGHGADRRVDRRSATAGPVPRPVGSGDSDGGRR